MSAGGQSSRRQLLGALTMGGLGLCGLSSQLARAGQQAGPLAADFTLPDLSGKPTRLSALRGQVVLLDFWASWCDPCMKELPELERLQRQLGSRGLCVLGVNLDESQKNAQALVARLGLTFKVLWDGGRTVAELYDPPKMPSSYLIDRTGRVRYLNPGFNGPSDVKRLEQQLGELLR